MTGKFFHTPKSKPFYIPYRFYDPQKEEMAAREQRIKRELGIQDENGSKLNYRETIKGSFRQTMGKESKSAGTRSSNIRLIILFMILAVAFYLYFF